MRDAAAPRLFDRPLARRRLARALAGSFPDFLVGRSAEELAERLSAVTRSFGAALDLGTPTGHAAAVLRAYAPDARIVRAAPVAGQGVDLVADEEALPLRPGSFDLAVSLLALHGANDLPGALVQLRRVLRPDGLLLACLLGEGSLRELRGCFAEAESELEAGASPRVAPFADVRAVGALMQRTGFALPVVDLDHVVVRYASPLALLADLRAMGLANALVERRRVPLRRATLMRALALYAERYADPDGRVRATFDIVWVSGWTPHESQPKPLKPGSARARLADALGVTELGPDAGGAP